MKKQADIGEVGCCTSTSTQGGVQSHPLCFIIAAVLSPGSGIKTQELMGGCYTKLNFVPLPIPHCTKHAWEAA